MQSDTHHEAIRNLQQHVASLVRSWAASPSVCDSRHVPKTSTWVLLITEDMDAGYCIEIALSVLLSVNVAMRNSQAKLCEIREISNMYTELMHNLRVVSE
jgi:hypothetical protein